MKLKTFRHHEWTILTFRITFHRTLKRKLFLCSNCMLNWVMFPMNDFFMNSDRVFVHPQKRVRELWDKQDHKNQCGERDENNKYIGKNIWWWNVFILVARFSFSSLVYTDGHEILMNGLFRECFCFQLIAYIKHVSADDLRFWLNHSMWSLS